MSIRIVWSDLAKANLKEIYTYNKEVAGLKVAKSIKSRIIMKPRLLSELPEMGQVEDNPIVADKGSGIWMKSIIKLFIRFTLRTKRY